MAPFQYHSEYSGTYTNPLTKQDEALRLQCVAYEPETAKTAVTTIKDSVDTAEIGFAKVKMIFGTPGPNSYPLMYSAMLSILFFILNLFKSKSKKTV